MSFEKAQLVVKEQLQSLDSKLLYHGINHTLEDVVPWAEKIAMGEHLSSDDILLVKTAALFHDTGFLDQYDKNEPRGCERARKYLPECGFSEEQIEKICECIMATQVPQSPRNKLSQIVCDADLSQLGTENYFIRTEFLRLELQKVKNIQISPRKWHESNINFLKQHKYWTDYAKSHLQPGKEQNLQAIFELLNITPY